MRVKIDRLCPHPHFISNSAFPACTLEDNLSREKGVSLVWKNSRDRPAHLGKYTVLVSANVTSRSTKAEPLNAEITWVLLRCMNKWQFTKQPAPEDILPYQVTLAHIWNHCGLFKQKGKRNMLNMYQGLLCLEIQSQERLAESMGLTQTLPEVLLKVKQLKSNP